MKTRDEVKAAMSVTAKPSDFPRDAKFHDPRTAPFRDEQGEYHVFSHADVQRVLMNADEAFARPSRQTSPWLAQPENYHMVFDFMWALEPFSIGGSPGRHKALRAVVEPWFRTRAVAALEPSIREISRKLIGEIVSTGKGEFNLARDLAYRVSIQVICRLVGIDLDRETWLREKLDEFSQAASFGKIPRQWDLEAYFWQLIARRLAHPDDDLLGVLATAWKDQVIDDRELMGYLAGFVMAGTDSVGTNLVNAFALPAEFGYLDYLRDNLDDDQALRRLVEEVIRFGTPFPVKPLIVLAETRFGDLVVPPGSVLNTWYASANRDEAVNGGAEQSDPNVFDPRRWPNRHVGLGYGPHYCLGGDLGRLETFILLQEAGRALPGLALDETKPFRRFAGIVDGVTEAHFRFDQDAAES